MLFYVKNFKYIIFNLLKLDKFAQKFYAKDFLFWLYISEILSFFPKKLEIGPFSESEYGLARLKTCAWLQILSKEKALLAIFFQSYHKSTIYNLL